MKLIKGKSFWNGLGRGWSALRNFGGFFSNKSATYKVDSSRVDYTLARSLYNNTNDDYKLGSAFAKPIINTTVGFMGLPSFQMEDESAQEVVDGFFEENTSKLLLTMRNSVRDGDCYVWVIREEEIDAKLYPEKKHRLTYRIIPPEMVKETMRDPISGAVLWYILEAVHEWTDEGGTTRRCTITQKIEKDLRTVTIEGDLPPGVEMHTIRETNDWGFIPIVEFKNESDEHELNGRSELEAVEPYLKAYHDVMTHAIQGNKMHSTPKLMLKVKDVASFLFHNFGVADPVKYAQEGKSITLGDRELLLMGVDEEAKFIEVKSATGDSTAILEFLFYCIVDVSEMPEFAFGVHTPSSLASVKEQMPILIRRIGRKRAHFDASFKRLVRIVLAMTTVAENIAIKNYNGVITWDDIDPRDGKEVAEEIEVITKALDRAVKGQFMSQEAAVDYLAGYIETMRPWDDPEQPGDQSEKRRIIDRKSVV